MILDLIIQAKLLLGSYNEYQKIIANKYSFDEYLP